MKIGIEYEDGKVKIRQEHEKYGNTTHEFTADQLSSAVEELSGGLKGLLQSFMQLYEEQKSASEEKPKEPGNLEREVEVKKEGE